MPLVYVLITNRSLGTMLKLSELKFTKRPFAVFNVEGKGAATIVVTGIGTVNTSAIVVATASTSLMSWTNTRRRMMA